MWIRCGYKNLIKNKENNTMRQINNYKYNHKQAKNCKWTKVTSKFRKIRKIVVTIYFFKK